MNLADFYYLRKASGAMKNPRTRFNDELFVEMGEDYLLQYLAKNVGTVDESRRKFIKGMMWGIGALAAGSVLDAFRGLQIPLIGAKSFVKMQLVDSTGSPVKASAIPVNNPVITLYEYPLQNEINFLLNLGDANGNPVSIPPSDVKVPLTGAVYKFPGGVGANKSIVSYSAICQHLGCEPPEIHLYPPDEMKTNMPPPAFLPTAALEAAKAANLPAVIHCDCHGSTYDPYHGASVLTGPTQRPLPAMVLEWDSGTDHLYVLDAVGVPVYGHINTLIGGEPVSGTSTEVSGTINPFPS
ncbi:MAG: Rieske 2Fe-2S domain-containing protein [Thermoplasmata archaeon]|uniref:Rieske 2Fe-2S domain-containing protein n=1 Tax=Candidatus Sysuiplasma superficiale TaxID=2823368 RepID=A0A8J7YQU7_9ARCH|nr:Rieske 2Fe-2S domain-containing protein [Candidatus Sysuiplasma superficiale]MBX8644929.1 Rieske 2Fe-2S domain-containing protein [Candidatus Sysuiplasma superficiale]